MIDVYLALGSNMGDREENLKKAVRLISDLPETQMRDVSRVYETEPVGYENQNRFLNMVLLIDTRLEPLELLLKTKEIEETLGRVRTIHWGPRTIDIDILLYGEQKVDLPQLEVPHARMLERAFVLIPLKDVYKKQMISGKSINYYINNSEDKDGLKYWGYLNG